MIIKINTLFRYIWGELFRWRERTLTFHLQPIHELTVDGVIWKAVGNDPSWKITPADSLMPRGWYMLSIDFKTDASQMKVKLYPNYGMGFNENSSFALSVPRGRKCKRICYFPKTPTQLRLDPCEMPCRFEVKHLSLVKITQVFSINRMEKKVYGKARSLLSTLANTKPAALKSLFQKYDKVFSQPNLNQSNQNYQEWLKNNELEGAIKKNKLGEIKFKPLISIVVPVWNTPAKLLRKCIESVRQQTYQNWQLCLCDDASTVPHVKSILAEYAASDPRIEYCCHEINGHICKASNSALELVKGEFLALLDHDDELSQHALMEVISTLQLNPDAQIIYSDEDKIDEQGNRFEPHFKPDWNRDLLYSQNYISHLGVYRTALVREIGGFRQGFEGSQDYDLLLRSVAKVTDSLIVHIPKILYHWRVAEGSTASGSENKPYTEKSGVLALQDHFKEIKQPTQVTTGRLPNTYRVHWPIPKNEPFVSLLIPTRDGYQILRQCVESILNLTNYKHYEIVILNNQSTCPKTLQYFEQIVANKRVRIIDYNQPFNFSAINNYGVAQAKGDIVGLVNNDIEVINADWLTQMVSNVIRSDIGCVGAKLYYSNDTIQHAGVVLGIGGVAGHSHKYFDRYHNGYFSRLNIVQNVSAVTGACLLVRKSIYNQVGGLNENDLSVAFNDVDFCLRVRQVGLRNLWTPYAELYHHESVSRGSEDTPEKKARFANEVTFMRKAWADELDNDPFYSPHLTKLREDFSLS